MHYSQIIPKLRDIVPLKHWHMDKVGSGYNIYYKDAFVEYVYAQYHEELNPRYILRRLHNLKIIKLTCQLKRK